MQLLKHSFRQYHRQPICLALIITFRLCDCACATNGVVIDLTSWIGTAGVTSQGRVDTGLAPIDLRFLALKSKRALQLVGCVNHWRSALCTPTKLSVHTNPRDSGQLQVTRSLSCIVALALLFIHSFASCWSLQHSFCPPDQMISHAISSLANTCSNGRHMRGASSNHRRQRKGISSAARPTAVDELLDWVG